MLVFMFWLLLGLILWTYAGYPILLRILPASSKHRPNGDVIEPSCTLVIAAYNEEQLIGEKLKNSLLTNYPQDKLQILVSSDCSIDRTHEIVRSFANRGVELVVLEERGGKTAAQNAAVRCAKGEIIVFTDASTEFTPDTIRNLVQPFSDPSVGAVGSELDYVSDGNTGIGKGAGAYWRYERWVKAMEASVNSLIGVSGCLYAVRKNLYPDISPDMISDFVIASEIYEQGFVTVYSHGAISKEKTLESTGEEFNMRVRVAVRSISALIRYSRMLNPFKHGFFAVQLFSHKVLRYLVPEFLIVLLVVHSLLVFKVGADFPYPALFVVHLAVYGLAALGWLAHVLGLKIPALHIPFYFMQVNVAALWALIRFIGGERKTIWTPIR